MSSCITCPVFVFVPNGSFQLVGLKSHTSFASPKQWWPVPGGLPWDILSTFFPSGSANIPADLLHLQLLLLPGTGADWTWSREFMLQQALLPCHALADKNHRQQQPKEQSLARHHSHNSNYSTATLAITSPCELIKVQAMCLRVLWGEVFLLLGVLLSLNIFYPW